MEHFIDVHDLRFFERELMGDFTGRFVVELADPGLEQQAFVVEGAGDAKCSRISRQLVELVHVDSAVLVADYVLQKEFVLAPSLLFLVRRG
jgi:hypothetical protein